jgi:hypothetical protein
LGVFEIDCFPNLKPLGREVIDVSERSRLPPTSTNPSGKKVTDNSRRFKSPSAFIKFLECWLQSDLNTSISFAHDLSGKAALSFIPSGIYFKK